jgi:hypothetical protein
MTEEDRGIHLVLIPAPGEDPMSPQYQRDLDELQHGFARANVKCSASMHVQESEGGGRWLDGHFWIEVLAIAGGIVQVGAPLLELWLSKKRDRRFTVERNGVTKQCSTREEVREFIAEMEKDASGPKVKIHDR